MNNELHKATVKFRTYLTPSPVLNEPLVAGLSMSEWQAVELAEAARFERGETKEITEDQFMNMVESEVLMGIRLPESVDDWLRNHLFTMAGRTSRSCRSFAAQQTLDREAARL